MAQAAIRRTVTQKVRGFLALQGEAPRPWSGLDETYGELYAVMNRRRDDAAFWPPLTQLLDDIVADLRDPESPRHLPAPQAELLGSWDVKMLVADLRRSLPGGEVQTDPTTVRRFGAKLSAQLLGGFLLLGLAAAGCNAEDDGDLPPGCAEASGTGWSESCGLNRSTVLWCTLATSSIETTEKQSLCSCFVNLNESWQGGLTGLFETEDAATVAEALGEMVDCICGSSVPTVREGDYRDPTSAPTPSGSFCDSTPIYKGVSYP